jgi:hypothetical protein
MDKRYRITIKIPAWHNKRLREWAALKGVAPTTLAGNVLQARIEANDQQIVAMLKSRSEDEGLTIEEFIKKIVNDSDDQEKPTR